MKTNHLLSAIGHVNDQYKQEVLDHMNKQKTGRYQAHPVCRTLRLIPAAAAIICLLAVTAYAAVNYWGIFDFNKTAPNPLPAEAETLVQTQDEVGSDDFVICAVKESLTDGQKLHLAVQIQAREQGKYILLCNIIDPSCQVRQIGVDADGTIEEYAKANNLQYIYVGASIKLTADGGTGAGSATEKYHAPDVVDILLERDIADMGSTTEGICVVSTYDETATSAADIHHTEIPFTFTNESASSENIYRPDSQPISGVEFGEATVTQTELGTIVEFPVKGAADSITFRRVDGADYREGGGVYDEFGNLFYHLEFAKEEFGDSFTLEAYNHSTDEVFGQIIFKR